MKRIEKDENIEMNKGMKKDENMKRMKKEEMDIFFTILKKINKIIDETK